jgi:hypothetical protein
MRCAQKSGMTWLRTTVAAVAVLGFLAVVSPPVGLAHPGDTIEQKIRDAKTPADHQALAAWYEQEAQAALQLASRYFVMRDVLAAARTVEQKNWAGEHWAFVAKKYQERAKADEILAAVHKTMAEQRKKAGACPARPCHQRSPIHFKA